MANFGNRLKESMEKAGVTSYKLAKDCGLSQSTLANWIKGSTEPDRIKVTYVSDYLGVNSEWLLSGVGEMLKTKKLFLNEVTPVEEGEYMMVEYVDLRASAGRLGGSVIEQLPDTHKRLVPKEFNNGRFLVIRVDGDSMYDGTARSLSDGDEVLVKEKCPERWSELPIRKTLFVITSREGNTIKQIKEINKEEGYVLCHSFNPSYEDFKIHFEDIFQIFVVCKVVQKQISLI